MNGKLIFAFTFALTSSLLAHAGDEDLAKPRGVPHYSIAELASGERILVTQDFIIPAYANSVGFEKTYVNQTGRQVRGVCTFETGLESKNFEYRVKAGRGLSVTHEGNSPGMGGVSFKGGASLLCQEFWDEPCNEPLWAKVLMPLILENPFKAHSCKAYFSMSQDDMEKHFPFAAKRPARQDF